MPGRTLSTFSFFMLTKPGLARLGLDTFFARVYDTATWPASRALLCQAAIAAACFVWRAPTADQWLLLAALGLAMFCAQALFIQAMRGGEAGRITPMLNITLIFAAAYDFALFGDVPTMLAAGGAVLIVAGVLIASRR